MAELKPIDLPVTQEAGTAFAPEAIKAGFTPMQTPTGATTFYKPPEIAKLAYDGTTNTSAPAEQQKEILGGQIANAQATVLPTEEIPGVAAMTKLGTDQASLLATRQTQLEQRRAAETERINLEFQRLAEQQAQQQKKEVGVTSTKLARMGGYLGEGTAGMQYEVALEQSHRQEVRDLESKRQAALQQSQQAFEDGDFKLAQQMLDTARQSEQTIYDRTQSYNQEKAKAKQQQMQEQKMQYEAEQTRRNYAMEYNIKSPYYTIDGQSVISTKTGEYIDINELPTDAEIQQIKRKPKASDVTIMTIGNQQYLVDKVTGETQLLGPIGAKYQTVDVGNRIKLIDISTGQEVADLGAKSYKPTGGRATTGKSAEEKEQEEIEDDVEDLIDFYEDRMDYAGGDLTREELIDKIAEELDLAWEDVAEFVYRRIQSGEEGGI